MTIERQPSYVYSRPTYIKSNETILFIVNKQQYDNTRGAWLTQELCTLTEMKEGRQCSIHLRKISYKVMCFSSTYRLAMKDMPVK